MAEPRSNAWLTVAILAGVAAIVLAIPKRAFAQEVVTGPVRDATPGAPARSPVAVEPGDDGAPAHRLEPGLDYFVRVDGDAAADVEALKTWLRQRGVTPVVTHERVEQLDPRWPMELRQGAGAGSRWAGVRVARTVLLPALQGLHVWGT